MEGKNCEFGATFPDSGTSARGPQAATPSTADALRKLAASQASIFRV